MSNQEAVQFDLCNQTDLENESMKEIIYFRSNTDNSN